MSATEDPRRQIVRGLELFFEGRQADEFACAYLFGSFARGSERSNSDVDVAVLLAEAPHTPAGAFRLDLADELEVALGRPVDLVVLNRAPVDLIHRVLRDGILVSENDRATRIRFEVRARNEYFDLLPYLREYRRTASIPAHD
jgi:predicted nucleotidyltransferase